MALGETGISVTAVRNESQQGNKNYISGLNTSSLVNPYSFWSPRGLQFNASTKILEPVTDPAPFAIGDFRRYNHSAVTPEFKNTNTTGYSFAPGTTTIQIGCMYDNRQANILRANPNALYIRIRMYTTYTSGTFGGLISTNVYNLTKNTTVDGYNLSPALSGHSVTQSQVYPSGSSGLMLVNFDVSGITDDTTRTRYAEMWFTDQTGSIEYGRLATNYFEFTVRRQAQPTLAMQGFDQPAGDNYFAPSNEIDTSLMSIGATTLNFRFKVRRTSDPANFAPSRSISLRYYNPDTDSYVLMTGYQNITYTQATVSTYSLTVTWALPSGRTWSYDSQHLIQVDWDTTDGSF